MAVMTAFVLFGGGYAVALKGSGTLQKENEVGIIQGSPETIRTIKGIGPLNVACAGDDGALDLDLLNDSGESLRVHVDLVSEDEGVAADPMIEQAGDGGILDLAEPNSTDEGVLRLHVFPSDGSTRPQAEATIGFVVGGGDCANAAQASILNLTTEE
jgi:hypothetical protein